MSGGVGREREKLSLTRLDCHGRNSKFENGEDDGFFLLKAPLSTRLFDPDVFYFIDLKTFRRSPPWDRATNRKSIIQYFTPSQFLRFDKIALKVLYFFLKSREFQTAGFGCYTLIEVPNENEVAF
jgi:hypothetical protein